MGLATSDFQRPVSSVCLDSASVLPLVKEAQNQHGLRHGDYRSYRCGEREGRGGEGRGGGGGGEGKGGGEEGR